MLRLVCVLSFAAAAAFGAVDDPPNVLFVLLDDVGVDRVGYYAEVDDPGATPTIDAICANGATARNAYACQTCSPTRLSLMTLDYPHLHGFGQAVKNDAPLATPPTDGSYAHLPAMLPGAYRTAAIGKWHMSNASNGGMHHPLAMGWDTHRGVAENIDDYFAWPYVVDGVEVGTVTEYVTTRQVDDALAFIEDEPGPWFCYLALSAPHAPFHVPPEHLNPSGVGPGSSDSDKYKAALTAADLELGRLLASIRPAILANTYVVVMGDNGTPTSVASPSHSPAKATLYEGGVNVPLPVDGPRSVTGTELIGLVQSVDVAATLVELCGGRIPEGRAGLAMPAFLCGRTPLSSRPMTYLHRAKPIGLGPYNVEFKSARGERFKVILDALGGTYEVYDLTADPEELTDLSGTGMTPEVRELLAFIAEVDP